MTEVGGSRAGAGAGACGRGGWSRDVYPVPVGGVFCKFCRLS